MSSNIPQQYKDAAQQLPADMLKEDFSVNGLTDKEVKAIHAKALFQENSVLLGLESGSVAGVNKRGAAAQDEKRKFEKQREKKQRETADTIALLLGKLDDALAPIEGALAEKYGEDYYAKLGEKYLPTSEFEALSEKYKDDPEGFKIAAREILSQRHKAGDIDIQEDDVRHWLDTYDAKVNELDIQIDRIIDTGIVQEDDSLKSVFKAALSNDTEQVKNAPNAEKATDDLVNNQTDKEVEVSGADAFLMS